MDINKLKTTFLVTRLGMKLLEETNDFYEDYADYLMKLKDEQRQTISGYLYVCKILASFEEKNRVEIIKLLNETNYNNI